MNMLLKGTDMNPITLLCIDDEPELRMLLVEELEDAGYRVLEAENGEEGLSMILSERPDLVLSDVSMPGMNGFELLATLRREHPAISARLPFVFLTALGDRDSQIRGRKLGADDYLVKPVDFDLMLATIESRLARLRIRNEIPQRSPREHILGELESAMSRGIELTLIALSIDGYAQASLRYGDLVIDDVLDTHLTSLLSMSATVLSMGAGTLVALTSMPVQAWQLEKLTSIHSNLKLGTSGSSLELSATVALAKLSDFLTATPSLPANSVLDRLFAAIAYGKKQGGRRVIECEQISHDLAMLEYVAAELPKALEHNELELWFQPKFSALDGRLMGAEALARWHAPGDRGWISPAVFIPYAESNGLMPLFDTWLFKALRQALMALAKTRFQGRLAFNISGAALNDTLVGRCANLLALGISPDRIEVEVTESAFVENLEQAKTTAQTLRGFGVHVAVDDFGAGQASLAYLKHFPVDSVKIDRVFVKNLGENEIDEHIISSVISLGKHLNWSVVAEGVETESQARRLTELGCHVLQGFRFAHPMCLKDFLAFLQNDHSLEITTSS